MPSPGGKRCGSAADMVRFGRRSATVVALLLLALAAWPLPAAHATPEEPADDAPVELVLFWGDGCPPCAAEKRFLADLQADFPDLVIRAYEVWYDDANRQLFVETAAAVGMEARSVPTTFVGDLVWVGYSDAVATDIRAVVEGAFEGRTVEPASRYVVDVPLLGEVDLGDRSLLLSTLVIGFVDGVNPCSLWVLSILLALVLHSGSRRRLAAVGSTFLLVTSAMYGLYIAGAYSALSYVGYLTWIEVGVAVVAGGLGILQLKEAFGVQAGPKLGIPNASKPGIYQRMRGLASPDRSLPALLGATAALAVGVSLLETPCTLGLPILWTNLLTEHGVGAAGAAALFAVYLLVFLIDELILFVTVLATMRALKVQERHGRALKLASGMVMVTLAVVMLVRPATMESVGGTLAVFGLALALVAAGLAVQAAVLRRHPPRPVPVTAAAGAAPSRPTRTTRPNRGRNPSRHR